MDWQNLTFAFDYLVNSGVTFSTEHRVALQASLIGLQNDNQFNRVQFWGRIEGIDTDYYIACGIGQDYINDRTYFYSINNGLDWILLSPPSARAAELGVYTKGHFIGDPTADAETEITIDKSDDIQEGEQWAFMKEEERLAAIVASITKEAAIVPRGALMKSPAGVIWENKTFNGLTKLDASQFHSYYHLKRPENPFDKNIILRADYNLTLDFLDSIAKDCPLGSWNIQINRDETIAIVRSLYWPGAVGFHVLGTPQYGWFYNGTGRKNWDLPFMISPVQSQARASIRDTYPVFPEDAGEAPGFPVDGGGDQMAKAKMSYNMGAIR